MTGTRGGWEINSPMTNIFVDDTGEGGESRFRPPLIGDVYHTIPPEDGAFYPQYLVFRYASSYILLPISPGVLIKCIWEGLF